MTGISLPANDRPFFVTTRLDERRVSTRLQVAVIADCIVGPFGRTTPGSTIDRLLSEEGHPYTSMWRKIKSFYESEGWDEFSDEELDRNISRIKNEAHSRIHVSRELLSKTASKWENYGWIRYEENRAQKFRKAQKYGRWGLIPLSIFTGINLFE